jgi:amino acid adenylation domain-containing protein/thioester reductase-like protein
MIIGALAIFKAGGAYLPLDTTYPEQRLNYISEDSGIKVLMTQGEPKEWVPEGIKGIYLDRDREFISQESTDNLAIDATPETLAYVIYTSGSTGNPKGVLVEHRSLLNLIIWHQETWQITEQDRSSQIASTAFDAAILDIWPYLTKGARLYLPTEMVRNNPEELRDWLVTNQISRSFMSTPLAERMLNVHWPKETALKTLLTGGDVLRQYPSKDIPFTLVNVYGPTECTVISTTSEVPIGPKECLPSIGRPIANTEIYILDNNLKPVPFGVVGEVYIGGAGVARGYINRPELTEERFTLDPFSKRKGARLYKTGDFAKYLPDGSLEYIGRIDNQVKIRGFRIEIGEIEAVLAQHAEVKKAVVVTKGNELLEKQLIAYVIGDITGKELREYAKEQLPNYMIPVSFVNLEEFPLTPNGKIDMKALPAPTEDAVKDGYVEPRTLVEELVVTIWKQVLDKNTIGVHDDFFELGGHSLLATQIVSRVQKAFQINLPLRDLFQYSTVERLSQRITILSQEEKEEDIPELKAMPRGEQIPLSYAQQRLWFLDKLEPNSSLYNIPTAWRLKGKWNIEALEEGYNLLIQRHEALRTVIQECNGEPTQVIKEYVQEFLKVTDIRDLSKEEKEIKVKALVQEEAEKSFDFGEGPLIRAQVILMEDEELVLFCTMHHIISDGWSLHILLNEWLTAYKAVKEGNMIELPLLAVQYADFTQWQRNWLKDEVLTQQLKYWQEELSGELPLLQLPFDYTRPAVQSYKGKTYKTIFSTALLDKIKAFTRQEGTTLFMTLLAAYQGFLSRYTGQNDILVGSPIANRHYNEIEGLIGFFVNTLVYRTKLTDDVTFKELVAQIRNKVLKAQEYQDVPFEKIVEALQPERNDSQSPLFQTMFTLQANTMKIPNMEGCRLETIPIETEVAKFDLTVIMEETDEELQVGFEYNTDLFHHLTIERMARHFENWLQEVMNLPQEPIKNLRLLDKKEEKSLLEEWNNAEKVNLDGSVIQDLLEEQVKVTPNTVALVYEGREWSYQEVHERANQLAHYLQKQGVESESVVGLCIERSPEMIIGALAILKAGGAYLPLDPAYPEQRLTYISQDAGIQILLTQGEVKEWLPEGIKGIYVDKDHQIIARESTESPVIKVTPENLAYVIYTSGSTGNPKGVMVEHKSLLNLVLWHQRVYQITEQDRATQIASIAFDAAVLDIWPYLTKGASLYIPNEITRTDSEILRDWLVTNKISITFMPTALAERMLKIEWPKNTALRWLLTGGDTLRQYPASDLPFTFINQYGPTECTVVATMGKVSAEAKYRVPSIGRPISNTQIYVLDDNRKPVPIGVAGELYIGGIGVARGYLNRPELTEERFIQNPFNNNKIDRLYRTGDFVKYLVDGSLEYVGRIDNQVKIRGFRIELGEIETVLGQYPTVKEAIVVAQTYKFGEKQLVAYIIGDSTSQELREYAKNQLPNHMIPVAFVMMDEFPLTPNGKIDTKALLVPDGELNKDDYIAPRNVSEELVVTIWKQVLGREIIGVHDDFFELGGHSLLATQIVSRIQKAFQVNLPLRELFQHSTVESLSQRITLLSQKETVDDIPELTPMPRGERIPLSYAQQRLWFIDKLEPNSSLYNIPIAWHLKGEWDIKALEQGYNSLIQRHEILRTVIQECNGEPIQVIKEYVQESLTTMDICSLSKGEKEVQLKTLLQEEAEKAFDFEEGPLIRAQIILMDDDEIVLLCTMHHIISDGWSMDILLNEWLTAYKAVNEGNMIELPPLSIQYADFTQWQRDWLKDEVLTKQLTYWKEELSGELPLLQLPFDYTRPAVQSYKGKTYKTIFSTELLDKIKAFNRQEGTTLFMTLLAAYQGFLSRYTGQKDILVGSPIANRNHNEIEGLIGFFVNTLVYRAKFTDDITFPELVAQVRRKALKAQQYQDVPFEKVVETLQPERNGSHSPLFQTMFIFQNTSQELLEIINHKIEPIPIEIEVAKFDLTVGMEETEVGLQISFEYNTDLFHASTIERMAKHFENWLNEAVDFPQKATRNLRLLGTSEEKQLVRDWNNTKVAYPAKHVIHELIEQRVSNTPNAVALVYKDQQLTYRELNERANQLAHYLKKKGVGPEQLVGICVERSCEMIVGLLGILKAGGAYVPLDPAYPEQRLQYIVNDSGIRILITQGESKKWLPEGIETIYVDQDREFISQESRANLAIEVKPDHLAYAIYTSGSTGNPKGVLLEHKGLCNLIHTYIDLMKLDSTSRLIQFASLSFDAAVIEIGKSLVAGGTLCISSQEDTIPGEPLTKFFQQHKITHATLPPAVLTMLDESKFEHLKVIISAGSACTEEVAKRWSTNRMFINAYGPTEATVCATTGVYEGQGNPHIGRPIPNVEVYVLDQNQQPVPIGVAGELYIGGIGVARGYLNRPELTEERFISHPFGNEKGARLYRTGDFVKYLPDGNIEYIGRMDNQVKVRGFRIELGEIEAILGQYSMIKEVAVVVREDRLGDKKVVAYVVGEGNAQDWREYIKAKLPSHMVPSYFIRMDNLPLTINGKVDTKALPTWDSAIQKGSNFMEARNKTERKLVEIWSNVLEIEQATISVHDSFFELGGHSMKITQALVKTLSEGWNITIKDYYELQTISKIAEKINAGTNIDPQISYSKLQFTKPPKKKIETQQVYQQFNDDHGVLLTGATGYLGIHLLEQLLDTTTCRVYCLVRGRNDEEAQVRLVEKLKFYFKDKFVKYNEWINKRIFIINGDLAEEKLGLSEELYLLLNRHIQTVIHAAALTKHFGDYADFERANVKALKEVLNFAGETKKLHYISTMSVSGQFALGETEQVFDENDLYIGQNYEGNVYIKSKFLAEQEIFNAVSKGCNAFIYRVGNLTNRYYDGQHQVNLSDNAFMGQMKFMLQYGVATHSLLSDGLEFTPVDSCSNAIVRLITSNINTNNAGEYVFHMYNHRKLTCEDVIAMLSRIGYPIKVLDDSEYRQFVLEISQDENKQEDIQMLMVSGEKMDNRYKRVKVDSILSLETLEIIDFHWPQISIEYVQKAVDYMFSTGFLPLRRSRTVPLVTE